MVLKPLPRRLRTMYAQLLIDKFPLYRSAIGFKIDEISALNEKIIDHAIIENN